MRNILMALLVSVFAQSVFAQTFVQESSFDNVTRKTGGAEYVISINQSTNQLLLNLEAGLVDPSKSSHKMQIHSIKYMNSSGTHVVLSNTFLTGNSSKLSLNITSGSDITTVIIIAESWKMYHGMYVSLEGVDNSAERQAEEEARQQAEEEARRQDEANAEAQRQAEINAEVERRRQAQCYGELNSASRRADNCISYDLRQETDKYTATERRRERLQTRLLRKQEPINQCEKESTAIVSRINSLKSDYTNLSRNFNQLNADMRTLKSNIIVATGTKFKCTMSRVGEKKRGTYVGEGPTKAQALMAALQTCPNHEKAGCGDQGKLRADISCVKIQ